MASSLEIMLLQQVTNPWKFSVSASNTDLTASGYVPFNATNFDPTVGWNAGALQWSVPVPGYYLVGFQLQCNPSASVDVTATILATGSSGTSTPTQVGSIATLTASTASTFGASGVVQLGATTSIGVYLTLGSSATVDFVTTSNIMSMFYAHLLSPMGVG